MVEFFELEHRPFPEATSINVMPLLKNAERKSGAIVLNQRPFEPSILGLSSPEISPLPSVESCNASLASRLLWGASGMSAIGNVMEKADRSMLVHSHAAPAFI